MAAIIVGVIVMHIAIATGFGLKETIKDKISGFNGHIQITYFDNNSSEETVSPIAIEQDFYPEFKQVEGIKNVQVYATKGGIIVEDKSWEGVLVKGVGADYDWSFFKEYLVAGRIPDFSSQTKSLEVLLSKTIASKLSLELGDFFNIYFLKEDLSKKPFVRKFEIVGLYDSGFSDFDENILLADIRHIQKFNKWKNGEVGGFEILLEDFDQIKEKQHEIYEQTPSNLNSTSIVNKFQSLFLWTSLFDNTVYAIIIFMIIIAAINMITALLVLILERTQMVGMLKAMGAQDWSIRKIFLYNASYLILRGLFWGNLIALSLLVIQDQFGLLQLDPKVYYTNTVPVYFNFWYILLLNIGTLVLCYLMLLIPSYIITKIVPVKAIKFD